MENNEQKKKERTWRKSEVLFLCGNFTKSSFMQNWRGRNKKTKRNSNNEAIIVFEHQKRVGKSYQGNDGRNSRHKNYPQNLQLLLVVYLTKAQRWRAGNVCTLEFRDEIIDGQWVNFLVLGESSHRVPLEVSDECDASGIVSWVRHDSAKKVRKFLPVTQRRRETPKRHLKLFAMRGS